MTVHTQGLFRAKHEAQMKGQVMQRMKLSLFTAGALVFCAAPALAATVTTDLNLRRGPGTGYHVVTSLPAGARIDVGRCRGSWCKVGWRGHSGYASANYISGEQRGLRPRWRTASAAARNPEVPRIWGYGFREQKKPAWPVFGSVIAPDFSTSPASLYPDDTRSRSID
jgi:hypothetical protein